MFDNLSERLERSFKILKGEGKITEINVAETLKDVRKALLDADVNYKVAKIFTDTVKEKALGQNVLTAVKPSQLMVKIVHDELTQLMGGETAEINIDARPAVILMSGLQGSGKTTFSGKLARMLKTKKNRKPLLVACDVYRPAAIEQLRVLAEQIEVPMYCGRNRTTRHSGSQSQRIRPRYRRYSRTSGSRRADDERDRRYQKSNQPGRNSVRGRLHDRSGRCKHS